MFDRQVMATYLEGLIVVGCDEMFTRSVLLVDEATAEREMYAEFLRKSGDCTLQASNAVDGYRLATELLPAIVITELALPGLSGFEFVRRLKHDDRTRHIPVIGLTRRVSPSDGRGSVTRRL